MRLNTDDLDKNLVYYLACPYTAIDAPTQQLRMNIEISRFKTITEIGASLTLRGLVILAPITVSHIFKIYEPALGTTWEFWKHVDTRLLTKADALIVAKMPGYLTSIGLNAEIQIIKAAKKPIYFLEPEDPSELDLEI